MYSVAVIVYFVWVECVNVYCNAAGVICVWYCVVLCIIGMWCAVCMCVVQYVWCVYMGCSVYVCVLYGVVWLVCPMCECGVWYVKSFVCNVGI